MKKFYLSARWWLETPTKKSDSIYLSAQMVKNPNLLAIRPCAPANPLQPDEETVPDAGGRVQATRLRHCVR